MRPKNSKAHTNDTINCGNKWNGAFSTQRTRVEMTDAEFLTWTPMCHNLERKNSLLYIKIERVFFLETASISKRHMLSCEKKFVFFVCLKKEKHN